LEYLVHGGLKGGLGVGKDERHYDIFVMAFIGLKGDFWNNE